MTLVSARHSPPAIPIAPLHELASQVAALRPSIKVVFMSGYTAEILTGSDVKAGRAFIPKPFTERGLSVKLREVLDTPPAKAVAPHPHDPGGPPRAAPD